MLERKRACLLGLVLLVMCAGCATTDPMSGYSYVKLQQIGEKFYAAGDIPQSLKYLLEAEKKNPKDPVIQFDLGLAYMARDLRSDALTHFQRALALKPDYAEALNAVGTLYADQGSYDLALDAFQKAVANPFYRTPQFAAYNLGQLYEKKGDTEAALKAYQNAVRIDPTYGLAYFRIGQILEGSRRGDEAKAAYGKAIRNAPTLAEAHFRYGVMSYQAGEMENALYSLTRVVKLAPDTSMADEAKRYLDKMQGIIPGPPPGGGFSSSGALSNVEVIGAQELETQKQEAIAAAPSAVPARKPASTVQERSLAAPSASSVAAPRPASTVQEKPQPAAGSSSFAAAAPASAVQEGAQAAPSAPSSPSGVSPSEASSAQEGTQTASSPPPEAGAVQPDGQPAAPAPPPQPQYSYIVQVASFLDKEHAHELQASLQKKGYAALVKAVKHQVLGLVYVIQLKPVTTPSKASTLMTQLGSEVKGEIVIIKVRAGK